MEEAYDSGWNAARWDAAHQNAPKTVNPFACWGDWARTVRERLGGTWDRGYLDFTSQEYTVT